MHSLPYNQMKVRGQLCAQAAFTLRESDPIAMEQDGGWAPEPVWTHGWRDRSLAPVGG
jgi:hypothetical protein